MVSSEALQLENLIWRLQSLMSKKDNSPQHKPHDIELPQSIIASYARFLVPEIRQSYESEEGKQALAQWQHKQQEDKANR